MTVNNTAKLSGRGSTGGAKSRSKATADTADTIEANVMSSENTVKPDSDAANGDADRSAQSEGGQPVAIQVREAVSLSSARPVMPDTFQVVETYSEAGVRPIGSSHLHLAGSFLNGRPIEASSLRVQETLPGNRPIFANDSRYIEGALLDRPILASDPKLLEGSYLPGNRPVASNETNDSDDTVMGFLD